MKLLNHLNSKSFTAMITLCVFSLPLTGAEEIGSFLLKKNGQGGQVTQVTSKTRSVENAPLQLDITMSAHGQEEAGADGLTVSIYSKDTHFIQLSRFSKKAEVGAVQYTINLKNLEDYLKRSDEALENLSVRLMTTSNNDYPYDIYISYSATEDSILLTSLDMSSNAPAINYRKFYQPAQSAETNDIVEGRFVVYKKGVSGKEDHLIDITNLYGHGIRELNVMIMSNEYGAGQRRIRIHEGSGVYVESK